MRIAVVGGTGAAGSRIVASARARGVDTVVVARSLGVDVVTGAGLSAALSGVDVVVDALNAPGTDEATARAFFLGAARTISSAASEVGVGRLVCLSIVGIDRAQGYGYYAAKLAQEDAYRQAPLPTTVVRSTQWHEFVDQLLATVRRGPVATVPRMRVQPAAVADVAEVVVDVATSADEGGLVEVAGPEVSEMVDLARRRLRDRRVRATVVPVPFPGAARAVRDGALLPGEGARIVGPTFDVWSAAHPQDERGARP